MSENHVQVSPARFDSKYYERFYENPRTRVATPDALEPRVSFVAAYLRYLDVPVRSVLDLGCGLGWWRQAALDAFGPRTRYVGVEVSAHLCAELGWEEGSVVDWSGAPCDLVVCQGVLQYLDDRSAERALANLARVTRRALYLEALTQEDWDRNVDQKRTDGDVHLRPAEFYRRGLARSFFCVGGGLFLPRRTDAVLFELERAERLADEDGDKG